MNMLLLRVFKPKKKISIFSRSMAQFKVSQKTSNFEDEINVDINGLNSLQPVTLYSHTKLDSGFVFASIAHYKADEKGCINLSRNPSIGGFYTGCESMGFLWSMKAHPKNEKPYARFLQADVATPVNIKLEIHNGHFNEFKSMDHTDRFISQTTIKKYIKHPSVTKEPLEGDVVGSVFVPEGKGPFPALITLYGATSFQIETKAAMLASRGILTLALAYYGKPGLPKTFEKFNLEYAEKAIDVLLKHPKTFTEKGIGVMGISMGGVIAQAMGSELEHITCVSPINCPIYTDQVEICYKGKSIPMPPKDYFYLQKMDISKNSYGFFMQPESPFDATSQKYLTNFYKRKNVNYLFQYSEDDRNCPWYLYAKQAKQLFDSVGHERYQIVTYPIAGHVLDPPHFPLYNFSYASWVDLVLPYGGTDPKPHNAAQAQSWENTISFMKSNLLVNSKL